MNPLRDSKILYFYFVLLSALFVHVANTFTFPSSTSTASRRCGKASSSNTKLHMDALLDRGDDNDDDDDGDNDENKDQPMMGMNRSNNVDLEEDEVSMILEEATALSSASKRKPASVQITEWKEKLRLSSPPPLTTMRRVRIEKEIALLRELADSDDAADELANLWTTEGGPLAAKVLSVADALVRRKNEQSAEKAEAILIHIVEQEGLQFVAPLLLLAWRYAMSGKAQESKDLYEMVLQQKPWHMGALVGFKNACKHLNDSQGMNAYESLPSVDAPAQRERWVERMVEIAQKALGNAEQGLQSYFDTTCDGEDLDGCIVYDDDFGEDAWQ